MAHNPQGKVAGTGKGFRTSGIEGRACGKSFNKRGMPMHMKRGKNAPQPGGQSASNSA